MLLTERGGCGRPIGLAYLSCPCLGVFAFSYVPSIRSIARSPSRIMNFSCPPAAPILCRYVPLNIRPFVAFFLTGSFASASFCSLKYKTDNSGH